MSEFKECPNPSCGNRGYIIEHKCNWVPSCCGNPLPTGECCGNGVMEPEEYPEQIQCEFCYTDPDSIFNNEEQQDDRLD